MPKKKKSDINPEIEKYINLLDFSKPIFIIATDQSTTYTGFIGAIMDFYSPDCVEKLDDQTIFTPKLIWVKSKEQVFRIKTTHLPSKTCYPSCLDRVDEFKLKMEKAIVDTQRSFTFDSAFFNYENCCFVCESVFLGHPNNVVSLMRYQTLAIEEARRKHILPFEYSNMEAKRSVGAAGSKENVTLCVNQIFNLEIPDDEEHSHLSDAIALAYHHTQILARCWEKHKNV